MLLRALERIAKMFVECFINLNELQSARKLIAVKVRMTSLPP